MSAHETFVDRLRVGSRIRIIRPGHPPVDVEVERVTMLPGQRVNLTTRAVDPPPITREQLDSAVCKAQPIGYVELAVDQLVELLAQHGVDVAGGTQ